MRVVIAPSARLDLASIGDFIAKANPVRAESFVDELQAACMILGHHPEAFALRPDLGIRVRVKFHRKYAIIYRVERDEVSVVRIAHAARNLQSLMLPGERLD